MDCKTCKDSRPADVPFIVHEADMARMERTNKRNTVIIVLLIIALLASWLGFMIYESKFETVTETTQDVWQEADNGGADSAHSRHYSDRHDDHNFRPAEAGSPIITTKAGGFSPAFTQSLQFFC